MSIIKDVLRDHSNWVQLEAHSGCKTNVERLTLIAASLGEIATTLYEPEKWEQRGKCLADMQLQLISFADSAELNYYKAYVENQGAESPGQTNCDCYLTLLESYTALISTVRHTASKELKQKALAMLVRNCLRFAKKLHVNMSYELKRQVEINANFGDSYKFI